MFIHIYWIAPILTIFFRLQCSCTINMTVSDNPKHSDCIQRAYQVFFPELFEPQLYVIDGSSVRLSLASPYCIKEVNGRKDFIIRNKVSTNCMSISKKSRIKFDGSGLFHFTVQAVKSNNTFCDLETNFLVFVADSTLPHLAKSLVRAMTSFCFGTVILCTFLIHYHMN